MQQNKHKLIYRYIDISYNRECPRNTKVMRGEKEHGQGYVQNEEDRRLESNHSSTNIKVKNSTNGHRDLK